MFRKRGLLLLTVSLVMGVSAAMVARGWVAGQAARDDKPEAATVIAASMAIPFGTKVEERHLKTIEMPRGSVPPGSFSAKEDVVDKVTTQPIVAGEILMQARFVEEGDGSTLAAMVDKNMRAVTVRVDDVIGQRFRLAGQFRHRPDPVDPPVADAYGAVLDRAIGHAAGPHRREVGVDPQCAPVRHFSPLFLRFSLR